MKKFIWSLIALLVFLTVSSQLTTKTIRINPGIPQTIEPVGDKATFETHADPKQKNVADQARNQQEKGHQERITADVSDSKPAILEISSDLANFFVETKTPALQSNQMSVDLIDHETWRISHQDTSSNLQTWTVALKRTETVRSIFFQKKQSNFVFKTPSEFSVMVGNSAESEQNPICVSGNAENSFWICGFSGSFLNLLAADTFFYNYSIMAFSNDVQEIVVEVDYEKSTTLIILPASMIITGVELLKSPQNPSHMLIRSSYQNLKACNVIDGPKHERGLSFKDNQIIINTDKPFLPQAIMIFVSCDCFLSMSQREIVFEDAYLGAQEQSISLASHGGNCHQWIIKFKDKSSRELELPYNGLSWDQSTSQVRLRPINKMDVGSHSVALIISFADLDSVQYEVSITFKVTEKFEYQRRLVGASGNCVTSALFVSLLYQNTVVASQSDFDPSSGSINSNSGCDGVTLWDYDPLNSVVTTNLQSVNFWRAAFLTSVAVETVMFINNDNNRPSYEFSMGDNPYVNLNPTCATVTDGGWVKCKGQGMYFGIWSHTLPVMFIEVQMYKQEAVQVSGGYSAAFAYLDASGAAQPLTDITYPAARALAAPLILYEYTSPARGNLCEISGSMGTLNLYSRFTMVLRAQVLIDSVVILCGDTKVTGATSWTTRCNNPTRISVQDVAGTTTACGTDIVSYKTYLEAPCTRHGNTIIAERILTASSSKMFLCGLGVLSSCDCALTTFDQTKMPLNIQNLVSATAMAAVVGGVMPTPITVTSLMQDTVSRVCGDGDGVTKCGQRLITVKRSTGESIDLTPWKGITFDQATWEIDLNPKSAGDIGVFTVNVRLSLADYPLVPPVLESITITVTGGPYHCKIPIGSMNLLNTAVIASQSTYKYGFNRMPFEACDGVILNEVDHTTGIVKKHAVSTDTHITSTLNVWTAQFSTTQSLKSALLINTEDLHAAEMSQFKLRIGTNADITLNSVCNQALDTNGGWYECVGSGTYFSIHSETTPVQLVEVMLYSLYFIQMNAHSAAITAEAANYSASSSITSKVIIRLLLQTNTCASSQLANDPVYLMTLNSQTKIKAIVLIPGNQDLCADCYDWVSNQKQVQVAVIDLTQHITLCGNPLSNYNTYSEALCNDTPGNQIQVKRLGQDVILSFCGVAVLTDCDCAYSSFDPIYSPLSNQELSQTSTINYSVGEQAQIIFLESLMQDSVSRTCGNGDGLTFCGTRTITVWTVAGSTPITSSPAVTGVTFQNNQITVFSNQDSDVSTFSVRAKITLNNNQLVFYQKDITVVISGRLASYCTISTDSMNLLNTSVLVTQSAFDPSYNTEPNTGCNSKIDYTLTQDKLENTLSPLVSPATTTYWIAKFIQSTLVQTALIINVDDPSQPLLQNDFLYVGDNPVPSVDKKCSIIPLDGGWWSCGLTGTYFAIVSTINNVVFVEVMLYSLHAIQMNAQAVAMVTAASLTGCIMPTIPISNIVVLDTTGTYRLSTCIAAAPTQLESSYQVTLNSEVFISGVVMLPVIKSAIAKDNTAANFYVTDVSGVSRNCGQMANYNTYSDLICNFSGNIVKVSRQGPSQNWSFSTFGILSPCSCLESSLEPTKMPLWTDNFVQLASMSVQINGVSQSNSINFSQQQDTVSRACGTSDGLTFCGQRRFDIFDGAIDISQQQQPYKGVLSWANPTLTLSADSIDQVTQFTITVKVSLQDYPLVSRTVNIPITVSRVQTACGEQDVASSNLLTSSTTSSQSGFTPNYNTDSGKGCDTQITTATMSFVVAKTSTKGSYWMADLISEKLIQTALIIVDQQFSNRMISSKLRVGASIWPSENNICNEQMSAGGWWLCGVLGRYFSIDSTTVEVAFSEIMLFSYYTIQQNAKALNSNLDPNFPVANSMLNTVMITSAEVNNCQKTIESTDPNFQFILNAPIVVQTLVVVPSIDQPWLSFQKDVTLCVKNTFKNTQSCKNGIDYSQKYLQVQMNFEGNVILVKKTGLTTLGFCSFSALSQCDCATTSFDLAKMPQLITMANTLVGPTSLKSTVGDAEKTITILNFNSVSQVCGKADGTFCGPSELTFTDTTIGTVISKWPYKGITYDELAQLLRFKPLNTVDAGAFTLKVTVSLKNYPAAQQTQEISVVVIANEVVDPCSSTKITTTSDLEIKVTLIYYKDVAQQLKVPAVSDSYSLSSSNVLACGPYEYTSSKEVQNIISFDLSKQIVTLFVTKKDDATFGTYDLSVSVGLKNYKKVTPLTFKYTYTLNKCLVSSIVPDFVTISTVIQINGSPVSLVMPNWVMTPDCGYLPLSYAVTGETSLVTQSPTQTDKTIKLRSSNTTIGESSTKSIIVSPVYSSSVNTLIPKQFAPVQINVAFSLSQENIQILEFQSNTTSFAPKTSIYANQVEQEGKVRELLPATVKFGKMNSKGLMMIYFSRAIVMPTYDIKEMTQLLLDTSKGLSYESSTSQRKLKSSSIKKDRRVPNLKLLIEFDEEQINQTDYTFFVSNITANNITIQSLFGNPIMISSGRAHDKLLIKVNSFAMFKTSDAKNVHINETQATQTQRLPSMQTNATAFVGAIAQTASDSTQIMFIALMIGKTFFDFGMSGLDNQMKALGLLLHLMCAGLMYPEVMSAFFGPLLSFLLVDIIPLSDWLQQGFDWKITPYTPNFDAMGYNSGYILYNLGSLSMLLVVTPIFALILKPIHKSQCLHVKIRAWAAKKYKELVWNGLIQMIDGNYLILLLCVLVNIKTFDGDWGKDMLLNNIFCILSFLVVASFPFVLFSLTWHFYDDIMDDESDLCKKFGGHMEGYHKKRNSKRVVMSSKFMYYPKVIMLCLAFVLLTEDPWAVISLNNFTTLYEIITVVYFYPYEDPKENFFHAKANIVFMVFNYHMFCLTPFVPDPQMRYYIGCSACSLVTLDILIAVIYWAKDTYPKIVRFFKKKCIYEPKIKQINDAKYKKIMDKIKKKGQVEDEENPKRRDRRANQVQQDANDFPVIQLASTAQQSKRKEALERIVENDQENIVSFESELAGLPRDGKLNSARMDVRIVKVVQQISLIKLEAGMEWVDDLLQQNLNDLAHLLPDDFETRSPRSSQIFVQDLVHVFQNQKAVVLPIPYQQIYDQQISSEEIMKAEAIKNDGNIGNRYEGATCQIGSQVIDYEVEGDQQKWPQEKFNSYQNVFESSQKLVKDYKEMEEAKEREIFKSIFRKGRTEEDKMRAKSHFIQQRENQDLN